MLLARLVASRALCKMELSVVYVYTKSGCLNLQKRQQRDWNGAKYLAADSRTRTIEITAAISLAQNTGKPRSKYCPPLTTFT